jgi:hypothetical protein
MLTLSRVVGNHSGSTLSDSAIGRLTDFMRRPLWPVILLVIVGYKPGGSAGRSDGNAALHLARLSARRGRRCSKLVGFFATVAGAL